MDMRKFGLVLICFGGLLAGSCQSSGGSGGAGAGTKEFSSSVKPASIALTSYRDSYPVFSVADTAYDFGTIKEGDKVSYDFRFKNTGSRPLIITGGSSTCGCTIPSFPKEAVPPGSEGKLKVVFNSAGKSGRQVKPVFITANTMPSRFNLKITCNVIPSK